MPRRSSRRVGSRALALIAVAIGAQLGAGEVAAATADDAASPPNPGEPSVTQQLAGEEATAPDPAAATASAATSAPAPPSAASSSVTVSRAKTSGTHTVSIVDFAFDPTALSVKLGDTVQWINNGTAEEGHNVIGDGLASPVLHTGESYSFTFSTAGTYEYICSIHPKMKATVEVIDPNADEPKPKTKKKKSGSKRGNSSAGASADGGGSSGSAGASGSATGSGSESAAGRSSDAAGTSGSLPSTGFRSLSLGLTGLALLALGLALRSVNLSRLGRRS